MASYRTLSGILVLVDIVNFTPQAAKLGDANMRRYLEYFKDKMKAIGERRKFKIIRTLGDALLLFGHDPEELLEIILDIFKREKLEDKYGFRSQLRMVGHFGFFQFEMENNSPVDLVSAEGIKVFRLKKKKGTGQKFPEIPCQDRGCLCRNRPCLCWDRGCLC